MKKIFLATFVFIFLLVSVWVMAEKAANNPVAVSPGSETEIFTEWQSCPTFSWSAVDQAAAYRVVVFESVDANAANAATYETMATMASPVVSKDITGPALSWTLSADEKLKTGGRYSWYVQALDANGNALGSWSGGKLFKVEQELRFAGIAEKLGEVLESYGVKDETITDVLSDMKSGVQEVGISGVKGFEGPENTFYGMNAGVSITSGNSNTFVGASAGYSDTTGYRNTFLGHYAGRNNTTGISNTFVGDNAGYFNNLTCNNTFVGASAGYSNNTGGNNTFIGAQAGFFDTTGGSNTFVGSSAGIANTSGANNIFLGYYTGASNTAGFNNIFLGSFTGRSNTTGNYNTFLGNYAGYSNTTGIQNTFLGYRAGYHETGSNKLYITNSDTTSPLIYGEFDNSIVTINGKLGIGTKTPLGQFEIETTGSNAVFILERTDGVQGKFTARPNEVYIGTGTDHNVKIVAHDNVVMTLTPDGYVGIGESAPSYPLHMASGAYCTSGGTWTNASSRVLKENIQNLSVDEAVEALTQLNPVKYNYKVDKADKHVGFIAEDVPDLVASADRKGLSSMDVTAVLTKVVQELKRENQEQQNLIREQQKINQEYKEIISDLQKRMAKLEKN